MYFRISVVILFLFLKSDPLCSQINYVNTNPFNNQYFIENNGQWDYRNADFVMWTGMDNIFIQKGGVGFIWDVNLIEIGDDEMSNPEGHTEFHEEESRKKRKIHTETIQFKLLNALPNAQVSVESKSRHYWTYGSKELNSFGYKRITYHNIYPQIDVVYEIGNPEDGQIKYGFVLNPGADIRDIKIQWLFNGNSNFNLVNNKIQFSSDVLQFQDSGLLATNVKFVKQEIKYKIFENYYGFEIVDGFSQNDKLIIDPYVKRITTLLNDNSYYSWMDFSNMVVMTDFDASNQIYLVSACLYYSQIAKYDTLGNINWIFSGLIPQINWNTSVYSNGSNPPSMIIDRHEKQIFIAKAMADFGDYAVGLNKNGIWNNYFFNQNDTRSQLESWDLKFNYNNGKLIIGGGFVGFQGNKKNLWIIDKKTDTIRPVYKSSTTDTFSHSQDVISAVTDEIGNYYSIVNFNREVYQWDSLSSSFIKDTTFFNICLSKWNPFIDTISWVKQMQPIANFNELENYPNLAKWEWLTNRNNCIAVNTDYLYLYDGKVILALDKDSGKILCADSIPYHIGPNGHNGQSGIAVDECNHLFLGGDSTKLLVFTFDGKKFNFDTTYQFIINSERACIDVRLNPNTGTLFVSGDSFTASMQNPYDCIKHSFSIDTAYAPHCQGDYIGMVETGDSALNYTYQWSIINNGNDTIIRVVEGVVGSSDTLKNPNLQDTIELLIAKYYGSNGEYQRVIFIPNRHDTVWVRDTFCMGDSVQLRNRVFTSDTSFVDRLTNVQYCDSWVNYHFVFNPLIFDTVHYDVCRGDTLKLGGRQITQTGLYWDTFSQVNGCDSLVLRDVLFWGSNDTQYVNRCRYDTLWVGSYPHYKTGFYSDTLTGFMGCDSIVNSDLRVHTDTNFVLIYEPCYGDTVLFSGQKYDSDGTHVDSFQSIWGCDSVVNRKIVFKEKIDTVINVTLCKNATYPYLGKDYNAPGDIYDTLQAWNQCDSFLHVQLELTTLKSDFDIDSTSVPLVTFINHSDEQIKFIWHFGDGNTDSTDENPEHRYSNEEDREIEVCLEVEDSLGCRDTLCKNIKIYKLGYWLYNVFTPNEDGYNDIHRIGHRGETFTYDIYIYNRWGGLVYQSEQTEIDDATKFWNGQVMNTGAACPSGTYFVLYQFYTKGTDADPETVEGVVELLR